MLSALPPPTDSRVLVDYRTGDDAGVFRIDEERALVQTVDFFTPVVDDPDAFGAIAAANALSDVYAMGGEPLTALSIAAFPDRDFPEEWARAIVAGGARVLAEAGCALVGGHSIRDPELKFGYAVTGVVEPARLITNAGGEAGQDLVLTKPLGTGIIATALKAGRAPEETVQAATRSMSALNREASSSARRHGVKCATDVTGFGLVGHAVALARQSGVSLRIDLSALPLLPGVLDLAVSNQAGGLKANRLAYRSEVEYRAERNDALEAVLHDPQTSGGLLLLVPPSETPALLAEVPTARAIGRAVSREGKPLIVEA